jgi:tRNA-specific 2-thiouridylase
MTRRIVVGMSGGVDSSAAAALLQRDGWEVIGVTLHLWDYVREGHEGRCCAPEDQYDAARVRAARHRALHLRPSRALSRGGGGSLRRRLRRRAHAEPLRALQRVGEARAPAEIADALGASHIASGHYARLEALRALVLPLGEMTKDEARAVASSAGLAVASKPDSTDLCFVEGGDYADFVARHLPGAPVVGPIESVEGAVLGAHEGIHRFTVGQRRGVGAAGAPRYVLRIVPERGAVVVGDAAEASTVDATVEGFRWLSPHRPAEVTARLRYRHPGVAAAVETLGEGRVRLRFASPQRGVAPGQAAVLYDGDRVVGGGFLADAAGAA